MTLAIRNKNSSRAQGFILIEVLVSLAVFSIGIMAVLTGVLSTLNLQKDSALRYRAGLLLQDKMLQLNELSYTGGVSQGLSPDGVFSWSISGEPWTGAPRPKKKSRNRRTFAPEPEQLSQVLVQVSWQSPRGPRQVTATQLVRISAVKKEIE